ncbi:MAG: hypothetical protein OXT64_11845 [Gammaproteobacteria bacterium]|nr:hypothetical protein [Gammaproteobacteria bacterium]
MNATVIDTLRFADRLKAAGFEAPHAEGLARALGSELAERIVTKSDLDGALRPIYARFDAIDASFDAMAGSSDARFDAVDARFDAMAGNTDARFDAADARFDALDEKIDSVHRELSGKFNILLGVMALGFTLLTGLGGYNAISPHYAKPIMAVPEAHEQASELRVAPSSPLPAGD